MQNHNTTKHLKKTGHHTLTQLGLTASIIRKYDKSRPLESPNELGLTREVIAKFSTGLRPPDSPALIAVKSRLSAKESGLTQRGTPYKQRNPCRERKPPQ